VFHSLRNTFIEVMEGSGVPESTVQLIVGHARQSLTFGSKGKGYPAVSAWTFAAQSIGISTWRLR
jgi:hypothetical protein